LEELDNTPLTHKQYEEKKKEISDAYTRYCEKQTNSASVLNNNAAGQSSGYKSPFQGK
jgi:hypothetical protein